MPSSTYANDTLSVTLSGTPTASLKNSGVPNPHEVWGSCTGAWTFRFTAGGVGFPVAAGALVRIPCASREIYFAGTGTLSLAVFGDSP